jgi:hypothetical protein
LVIVTLALGTAAPDGSVTVPVNWPFWICATAPTVNSRIQNTTKQQSSLFITPILPELFNRFETAIDRTCISSRADNYLLTSLRYNYCAATLNVSALKSPFKKRAIVRLRIAAVKLSC